MKIYFHFDIENFANCYLITNSKTREALIIDPCKITVDLLNQIENGRFSLTGVFVTHNHPAHIRGLETLRKIYSPNVYAADYEVAGASTIILKDSGVIREAGLDVQFFSTPGHSFDSVCYAIAQVVFTGDVITAGLIGSTNSNYAKHSLITNIQAKIFCKEDFYVLMPGHGPPSTIGAEKKANIEFAK